MRQHDGHAPGLRGHRLDHVLHPGVVAALVRRHAGEVASVGIAGPDLVAPLLQRERRIGDDAVERRQVVAREERRVAQRVAANDLEVRGAVQEQVHPGDGGGGEVLLLTEELAPERAVVAVLLPHVVDGFEQHAARAARRVVDGLAFVRVEDVDHQPDDGARRVELARLLVGGVGELLDQVLVGLAEDVGLRRLVAQRDAREVLDQVAQQRIGQALLVRPLGVAEDAVERFRVRLLDAAHGLLQRLPDVGRHRPHVAPVAILWNLEAVVLRESGRTPRRRRTPPAPSAYSSSWTSERRLKNSSGKT